MHPLLSKDVREDTAPKPADMDESTTLLPSALSRASAVLTSQCAWVQTLANQALQRLAVKALSMGPLPRHIAFIMDGNRRWSRANGVRVPEGHKMGFEALRRVLELCMALEGIYMVTVYAFAIDNFKRDREEVSALMELAKTRLLELYDHGYVSLTYAARLSLDTRCACASSAGGTCSPAMCRKR